MGLSHMGGPSFSDRLKAALISAGYKKKDGSPNVNKFAVKHGFSAQSVRNWTGGTEPKLADFFRLCDVLEVDPRWMAIGEEGKEARQRKVV